ncbi:hypothetical protein N9242_02915 [Vicingaceae bacterium]|nr:hypothetical protein [Vicingaceae bacterium]
MDKILIDNRYKQVMIPAVLMGIITNISLAFLFAFLKAFDVVLSPIVSTVLFLIYFFLLKTDRLSSKQISLIVAYTVVIEIFVHSFYLGWDMGFYYYMFLLPIIFLLNSKWETWMVVFFNSSILLLSILLWCLVYNEVPVYLVDKNIVGYLDLFNLTTTALVILVIMIHFSRTINKKDEDLVKINIELEHQNQEIVGQHQNLEVLLKEVHHRVKNNLQIISSLMSLEHGNVENEEVGIILNESRRRVEAIALIHHKLYQDKKFNRVDFKSYLEEIMNTQHELNPEINCTVRAIDVVMSLDVAVPLGLIISEMITNSVKHAFIGIEKPELLAVLSKEEEGFQLLIEDNGIGLSKDFDLVHSESLGLEIITALTDQIEGSIECYNNQNGGASFKLCFNDQIIID